MLGIHGALILSQSPVQCQSCPPSGCDITQRDVVTCDRSWEWGGDSVSWERLQVPFPGLSLWRAWAAHEGRMGVESSRVPWSLELPLPAPRQAGLFCVKGINLHRQWLMGRPFAGAADSRFPPQSVFVTHHGVLVSSEGQSLGLCLVFARFLVLHHVTSHPTRQW